MSDQKLKHTTKEILEASRLLDGIGYSAVDGPAARAILRSPTQTARQIRSLWGILGKYRSQLEGLGVRYGSLVPPELTAASVPEKFTPQATVRLVPVDTSRGHEVAVLFSYDAAISGALEPCRKRWLDKEGRNSGGFRNAWIIPLDLDEVEGFLRRLNRISVTWAVDPEVTTPLKRERERRKLNLTESRAESADLKIPTNKPLYPFQRAGVKWLNDHDGRALLADDQGCVEGGAVLNVNRAGKGFRVSLAKAFRAFHKTWNKKIDTYCRALVDGELHQHKVKNILYKGERQVVLVTLASGKSIRVTPDHELAMVDGSWRPAEALRKGDKVFTNGALKCLGCGGTKKVSAYKYAKFRGFCRKCMYRTKRVNHTWKGGKFIDKDGYVQVSQQWDHPRGHRGVVPEHILVMEKHLGRFIVWPDQVHHKNENRSDNRLKNLKLMSPEEHHHEHKKYLHLNGGRTGKGGLVVFVPSVDKVASVKAAGKTDVYDMVMENPHRNFIANGIVVHNCGKTPQALGWLTLHPEALPAIVVCPSSVRANWKLIAEDFTGFKTLIMTAKSSLKAFLDVGLPASDQPDDGYDLTVINYDLFRSHETERSKKAREKAKLDPTKPQPRKEYEHTLAGLPMSRYSKFKTVIYDEIQKLKDVGSQRGRAGKALAAGAKYVIGLSGTPMPNRPIEIFNPMKIIRPKTFPDYIEFGTKFCAGFQSRFGWDFTGSSNLDKLDETLRSKGGMMRRLKTDVLKELPPKTRITIPIVIEKGLAQYRKVAEPILEKLVEQKAEREAWRAELGVMAPSERKKYLAAHAEEAIRKSKLTAYMLDEIEKVKQAAVNAKFDEAMGFFLDLCETKKKLLLFTTHHETTDRMMEVFHTEKIKAVVIDGRTSQAARPGIVKDFQEGDLEVLVGGIKAMSEGLTLTAADTVGFMEFSWNAADHAQAEDRLHRISQLKAVTAYYTVALGTIEEKLARMIDAKGAVSFAALGESDRLLNEKGIMESVLDGFLKAA
jgi:SWI/SNF-related matrix-associated actin-dependent regulator 1 of chromatin subfamily A